MPMLAIAAKDDENDENLEKSLTVFHIESKWPVQFATNHIEAQQQIKNRARRNEVDREHVYNFI